MQLEQWARHWAIHPAAINDLRTRLGLINTDPNPLHGASETAVQNAQRLHASKVGARMWRNNSGAYKDRRGRLVRYGLCNDSEVLNEAIKSSDLVGCTPVRVTLDMVGSIIGQFTAVECKRVGWTWTGNEHERAQLAYLTLVYSLGGRAFFVDSVSNNGYWAERR